MVDVGNEQRGCLGMLKIKVVVNERKIVLGTPLHTTQSDAWRPLTTITQGVGLYLPDGKDRQRLVPRG